MTLSGISGNLEQKTILQTTEQLIQFTVLEIQFRSLKYTSVIRIRKNLSNLPFLCSAIDSITQNEESKIDYEYVMMMRNNKFEYTVEIETPNNAPLNYFFLLVLSYGIWNVIHFITIP